ncbi:hypothetical protein [Flavobacterium inviolabile]|uniref:hypothetical protein n=1 Tax=Flavobacterium inviolabile TaxID=2748320 RepID=UPI0015AEAF45|nr:hypothetical protein [Flavobacterium inviolabile]
MASCSRLALILDNEKADTFLSACPSGLLTGLISGATALTVCCSGCGGETATVSTTGAVVAVLTAAGTVISAGAVVGFGLFLKKSGGIINCLAFFFLHQN